MVFEKKNVCKKKVYMRRWLGYHTVLNVCSATHKTFYNFNDGSSLDMVTLQNITNNRLTYFESQGDCQWIYNYGITITNNKPCLNLLWNDVNFVNYSMSLLTQILMPVTCCICFFLSFFRCFYLFWFCST